MSDQQDQQEPQEQHEAPEEQAHAVGVGDVAGGATAGEQPPAPTPSPAASVATEPATPPPPPPPHVADLSTQYAALVATLREELDRHGVPGDVRVGVYLVDEDGRGGVVGLVAGDNATAGFAAGTLRDGGDGREWRFIGSGPAGDTHRAVYLHVSPLA